MQSQSVRIATCHDQAEAMMIRAMLSAHGIEAMIPGGGASAGVAAVGFITHVFVDAEDAAEASALISDMRAVAGPTGDADGRDDADAAEGDTPGPDLNVALERRARGGAVVLIAVLIQFGSAHISTGAWKRGILLAAVELYGLRQLVVGGRYGAFLMVSAVVLDLIGAVIRTYRRASPASRLPVARVARGSGSRDPR